MRTFPLGEILSVLDKDEVLHAVRASFISKELGNTSSPQPMQILFHNEQGDLTGDCHVKAAQDSEIPYFVIKAATGFYHNKALGLPVNNGFSLLMSAQTGQPVALFQDEGMLTSLRTAAAGALAASLAPNIHSEDILAVVGTGHQAELQILWIAHLTGIKRMRVLGRNFDAATQFAHKITSLGFDCIAVRSAKELAEKAKIIVTATPSTKAMLMSEDVPDGVHIVALGADSPGKQELDPKLLKRAEIIITDDHQQCIEHGEFGIAYRSNLIDDNADISLGAVLSGKVAPTISGQGISIVDLTGLGGQDLAIAMVVWHRLNSQT